VNIAVEKFLKND